MLLSRFALCFAVAALFVVALPTASAQDARVLSTWDDPVKLDDGTETVYRYEVSYDYATGIALRRAYDGGTLVETIEMTKPPAPTLEEIEQARALIRQDAGLSDTLARSGATIEGGFLLRRADGACGPGSRCLQFDLIAPSRTESVQFVVVDLAQRAVVERDLYPDL